MYNRYVPQPDGSFRRNRAGEPERTTSKPQPSKPQPCPPPPPPEKCIKQEHRHTNPPKNTQQHTGDGFLRQLLPKDFDTGDLLVIALLLLMAGDCAEDRNNAILTIALYFLM